MNKDYYIKLQAKIDDSSKTINELNKQISDMSKHVKELEIKLNTNKAENSAKKVKGEFKTLEEALKQVGLSTDKLNKEFTTSKTKLDSANKTIIRYKNSLGQQLDITTKIDGETKSYSASIVKLNNDLARNANTTANLNSQYKEQGEVFKQLKANIEDYEMLHSSVDTNGNETQVWTDNAGKMITLNGKLIDGQVKYKGTLKEVNSAIDANAKQADKWQYSWSKAFQSFTTYMSVSTIFYQTVRTIKSMIEEVMELDSALVELRKVTDLEGESLNKFVAEAYKAGEAVAKTGTEMVEAATAFAKAGYGSDLALQLGTVAAMYTNIADEEIKVADAADMIIAQMKAFNMDETEQTAMRIIDVINEVSNNFAVSSADIANNLGKASAVMANAGNSYEQMVALMTAGTEVTRSATKVANGLKTITLRLQGMNDEGEKSLELVAQMEGLYQKLGITVYNTDGTLKNTYDLLGELASVYGDLTTAEKAYVTETIAGKYQAQNAAAILSNWQTAVKSLETAMDSSGSAMVENEKILDSIEGKVQAFKSAFEELASTTIDSDLVKGVIDLGTAFIKLSSSSVGQAIIKMTVLFSLLRVGTSAFNAMRDAVHANTLILGLNTVAKTKNALASTSLTNAERKEIVQLLLSKGAFDKNTKAMTKSTAGKLKEILASSNLTKAQQKEVVAKISGAAANGTLTASTFTLKGAVDALTASIAANPIGAILVAATALISVISSITSAIKENNEERRQALEELKQQQDETYSNTSKGLNEELDRLEELDDRLKAHNITQSEAVSIKEELIEVQKSLNEKYSTEAENIDLVNGKLDDEIKKVKELKKQKAKDYLTDNATGVAEVDYITYSDNRVHSNIGGVTGDNDKFVRDLLNQSWEFDIEKNRTYAEWFYNKIKERIEALNESYTKALNEGDNKGAEKIKKQLDELTAYNKDVKDQAEKSLTTFYNGIDAYLSINDKLGEYYQALADGATDGEIMGKVWDELEAMKSDGQINKDWANNVYEYLRDLYHQNWDKIAEENERAAYDALDDYQRGALGRLEAGTSDNPFDALFGQDYDKLAEDFQKVYDGLKEMADNGALTEEQIIELINAFDAFNIVNGQLVDTFGNEIGSIQNIKDYFNTLTSDMDGATKIAMEYSTQLDKIKGQYDLLTAAVDEYNSAGYLSAETLQKLIDNDLLSYLSLENELLIANTESLYENAEVARAAATQKLYNAMADDVMAVAEGRLEDVSVFAKDAIDKLGNEAEESGNQAANATDKFISFAEAVDLSNKALSGKELTSDVRNNIKAVQDAYKPLFDMYSKPIQIEKRYSGSGSTSSSSSSSKTEKEWWEIELENLKEQFKYNEITIEEYISCLSNLLGKVEKGTDAWRKINEELQKQRLTKVEDDYKRGVISLDEYINKLKELIKAYKEGSDAWNDLADKIKKALQDKAKNQKSDLDTAEKAAIGIIGDEINKLKDLKDEQKDYYDKLIEDKKKANDETERELELARLQEALANAKAEKTKRVWREGIGWVWEADQKAIEDAQKALDEFENEEEIKALEEQRDAAIKAIEDQIDAWEEYKKSWEDVADDYETQQKRQVLAQQLGADAEAKILEQRLDVLEKYKNGYLATMKEINDLESLSSQQAAGGSNPSTSTGGVSVPSSSGGSSKSYTVQKGDTLSGIGSKYGISWQKIYDANKATIGSNPNKIYPGQTLTIPGYSDGGIVDYTGLAMLHGSSSKPEFVLNNDQMKNLINTYVLPRTSSNLPGGQSSVTNYNFGNIELPNVNNAQQFITELKSLVNIQRHQ